MRRRDLIVGGAALAGWGLTSARAAPVLSASNYGMTARQAARRNGWIEVDAAAFEGNIAAVRGIVGAARICAVMKADAYGNGVALLIPSIIKLGIRDVAITSNDEARVARALGYRGRLLRVRTATPDEMEDALPFALEELIGNAELAARLAKMAQARGRPVRVHLALNSGGMSRNGVELSTPYGQADARAMLALKALRIVGVMTHYPTEDAADILGQLGRFEADTAWLAHEGLDFAGVTRHTASTFAALSFPATRLDMVRVGDAIYGELASFRNSSFNTDSFALVPAIKARVAAVNHYPAGQTVNYSRTFRLARESWLANIPIGYSDGFRRGFSHANRPEFAAETTNDSAVLIGGQRFPIVGRITMNTLMADVTGWQDKVGVGDEVVMLGTQGTQRIVQAEFEANSGGHLGEMFTMLGATMPRVLKPRR